MIKTDVACITHLLQTSSWQGKSDIRGQPAQCHSLTECCPHWWTALPAEKVCWDPRLTGSEPEERPPLTHNDRKTDLYPSVYLHSTFVNICIGIFTGLTTMTELLHTTCISNWICGNAATGMLWSFEKISVNMFVITVWCLTFCLRWCNEVWATVKSARIFNEAVYDWS